ncbi:hypothetical protein AVEN_234811-1 [Araneus ventricosus]|uniref:Endonuclease/exonuclease/phosphatase domain-containing protein n=1 Tax=Araneus ventricosus TaxID=182803 RepID=A0A4Y2F6F7_ARAVE|nr:hypothetical protein AVEN_234811-1 [Araneus ventricosus]
MKAERLREVSGSHNMAAALLTVTSLAPIGKDRNAHSLFIPPYVLNVAMVYANLRCPGSLSIQNSISLAWSESLPKCAYTGPPPSEREMREQYDGNRKTSSYPLTKISAYSSPAQDDHTVLQEIQEISFGLPQEKILIGTDLNGHNTLWGYRSNDNRGNDILEFILANNLYIINKPDAPQTFQRNNSVVWPGITLCSQSHIDSTINWEILDEKTLRDHIYIETKQHQE